MYPSSQKKEDYLEYYRSQNFFQNKNCIVTGATGGVGSLLIQYLCDLGANVVAFVKDEKKFINIFRPLIETRKLTYETIDFTKKDPRDNFKSAAMKLNGKIDSIFLCHGKYNVGKLEQISLEEYDNIVNINTRSFMNIISLATPFLKISKGNVVAISSMESYIPIKSGLLNTITKSMVNQLIQCAALELASFGIRINGVAPGIINTQHRVGVNENFGINENDMYLEKMGTYNILNKKVVEPEDIVNCCLFLASDDAEFMTGEIIKVDNGYSLNHDLCFS